MIQKQKKSGIIVLTNAGGVGVVCLDLIAKTELELFPINSNLEQELQNILPKAASIKNPIDILGDSKSDRYKNCLDILVQQADLEGIIVIVTPQIMTDVANISEVILEVSGQNPNLPIIPVFIGQELVETAKLNFTQNSFPSYTSPKSAIETLEKYLDYKNYHKKTQPILDLKQADYSQSSKEISQLNKIIKATKNSSLDYLNTTKIAKIFDIDIADFCLIVTDGVLDITLANKFLKQYKTCVIKVVSGGILHRSEYKMVQIDITTTQQIQEFCNKFADLKPEIVLQEMVEGGIQCFVGINRDVQFGNALVVGTGGIYAEITNDFTLIPLPTSDTKIRQALEQTKLYKILNGARNHFWDVDFFVKNILNLSQILDYFPGMSSIDINPFIVLENGGKVVDFKVVL